MVDTKKDVKRILAFDFSRGWAISFVVGFHLMVIHAMQGTNNAVQNVPLYVQILASPLIILGSWASVFALISGASNAYSIYRQLLQNKANLGKKLKSSIIRTFFLLVFHFIYVYFFIHPLVNFLGEPQESVFVGSIRHLSWQLPSTSILFVSSALSMLAFSEFAVTMTIFVLCRNKGYLKIKRNIISITITASIIVLSGSILQELLTPYMLQAYENKNYALALLLVWCIGRYHCAFPFIGFAFYGALIGMGVAYDLEFPKIRKIGYTIGYIYLIISISSIFILGITDINVFFSSSPQHFSFYTLNLALQCFLFTWLVGKLDYSDPVKREKYAKWTLGVRRWGLISLTIFLAEGVVGTTFSMLFNAIFGDLMKNYVFIFFVFTPIVIYIWVAFQEAWDKHDFRYSIEWLLARQAASKSKDVDPKNYMHIDEYLYRPAGFTIVGGKKRKIKPEERESSLQIKENDENNKK